MKEWYVKKIFYGKFGKVSPSLSISLIPAGSTTLKKGYIAWVGGFLRLALIKKLQLFLQPLRPGRGDKGKLVI